MPEVAGNWSLTFELRAGSNQTQQKGVILDDVKMWGKKLPETLSEHFAHTSPTSTLSTTTNSTMTSPSTTKGPTPGTITSARIFGTKATEIFMVILVVIIGIALAVLCLKYLQLRDKLKEYQMHGSAPGTGRYFAGGNPAYDNPVYGGQRSAERYEHRGSAPYHIDLTNGRNQN